MNCVEKLILFDESKLVSLNGDISIYTYEFYFTVLRLVYICATKGNIKNLSDRMGDGHSGPNNFRLHSVS